MLVPSRYPRSRSPCRKASAFGSGVVGVGVTLADSNPIRGTVVGGCASAASGTPRRLRTRVRSSPTGGGVIGAAWGVGREGAPLGPRAKVVQHRLRAFRQSDHIVRRQWGGARLKAHLHPRALVRWRCLQGAPFPHVDPGPIGLEREDFDVAPPPPGGGT